MPELRTFPALSAAVPGLRRDVVVEQLDDLNALAEEWAAALRDSSVAQADQVRADIEKRVLAMSWNIESTRDAVLGYAAARADGDDELFAPGLVLCRAEKNTPDTATLLARLSDDARALLAKF